MFERKENKTQNLSNSSLRLVDLPNEVIMLMVAKLSMKDQRTFSHCNKSLKTLMRTEDLIRYKLSDESCRKYVDDLFFREVVDLRGRVWEFTLYDHPTMDVTFLSRVHTLKLSGMTGVTDVSALSQVHNLTLWIMPGVTDVSALSKVHTLELWGMYGVTDVSALSSVHTLALNWMDGVRDVSALSSVHTLKIDNCNIITKHIRKDM